MKLLTKRQEYYRTRLRGSNRIVYAPLPQIGGGSYSEMFEGGIKALGNALFSQASKDIATKIATDAATSAATGAATEIANMGKDYVMDTYVRPKKKENEESSEEIIAKLLQDAQLGVVKKLPKNKKAVDKDSKAIIQSLINAKGLKTRKRQIGKGFKII